MTQPSNPRLCESCSKWFTVNTTEVYVDREGRNHRFCIECHMHWTIPDPDPRSPEGRVLASVLIDLASSRAAKAMLQRWALHVGFENYADEEDLVANAFARAIDRILYLEGLLRDRGVETLTQHHIWRCEELNCDMPEDDPVHVLV